MELTESNGWRRSSKSSHELLLKVSKYGRRRRAREYAGIVLGGAAEFTTLLLAGYTTLLLAGYTTLLLAGYTTLLLAGYTSVTDVA